MRLAPIKPLAPRTRIGPCRLCDSCSPVGSHGINSARMLRGIQSALFAVKFLRTVVTAGITPRKAMRELRRLPAEQQGVRQHLARAAVRHVLFENQQRLRFLQLLQELRRHRLAAEGKFREHPKIGPAGFGQAGDRAQMLPARGPTTTTVGPSPRTVAARAVSRRRETRRRFAAAKPQVGRMLKADEEIDDRRDVDGKSRDEGVHPLQAQQGPVVAQGVVRCAHHAVAVAATVADDLDGHVVHANIVPNLLVRPRVNERRRCCNQGADPLHASPAATDTIFCSATPALMKRAPAAACSGSSAWKPRSPVRKTNSASAGVPDQRLAEKVPHRFCVS